MISICFQGKPFNITVTQFYSPTRNAEEAEVESFYEDIQNHLELTSPKDVLFIIGDWNAKVRGQEIPGVTGKSDLGVQNKEGQRLTEFCQENTLVLASSNNIREDSMYLVNTEIWWIMLFAAKDGEALYSQQKQDLELTMAQIMSSLLPNSDLNWESRENH